LPRAINSAGAFDIDAVDAAEVAGAADAAPLGVEVPLACEGASAAMALVTSDGAREVLGLGG
jgi:hypothetical protein